MNSNNNNSHQAIILFDGVCNYCNSWVNFCIRHDKKNYFRYAPLQSEIGKAILKKFNVPDVSTDTFVLIENSKYYLRSTAGLRLCKHFNGLYPLLYGFIIVPPFIRDGIYGIIARNRYKWYGKRESCMVPSPDVKEKFL